MPRVRILSNTQALFVGPSPSSGYHFLTSGGALTGITQFSVSSGALALPTAARNAIKQINGLSEISYDIVSDRLDIKELGRKSNVNRSHVSHPEVNLSFSYYGLDLRNEIRMGFNVNFPTGTGKSPFYPENFTVPIFSGFTSRATGAAYSGYSAWPLKDRDRRNFFVSIAPEGVDAMSNPDFLTSHVVGFGDCHIKSYSVALSVNEIIKHDASYSVENVVFYLSGSGQIPAVNAKNLQAINNNLFVIPKFEPQLISKDILRASDATFDIVSTGYGPLAEDVKDIGFNFLDMKVQSAKIDVDFDRQDLKGLGYRNSVDRVIKNPILAELSLEAIVGDDQEGRLRDMLIKDHSYDLTLKVLTPPGCEDRPQETVVRYDLLKAKFNSIQYGNALNEGKTVSLDFTSEITDDVTGRGLYISGRVFKTGEPFSGFNF